MMFTFDDVLIKPTFSYINSRKDVSLHTTVNQDLELNIPIISANMDSITGPMMARTMRALGGIGCLHRFCSIEENIAMFQDSRFGLVSIGIGSKELERAAALYSAGASYMVVDVAHGAQMSVVEHVNKLNEMFGDNIKIIVGNFATGESIKTFKSLLRNRNATNTFKVGIGPGSACTTRTTTGVGVPQLSAIIDCVSSGENIIADGGCRTPGDVAKALGAGAKAVMLGGMLAGTDETPGEIIHNITGGTMKKYRGSASKESYAAQGKDEAWRTAEGESFLVPSKGGVADIILEITGGIRSAMTYTNSMTLKQFHENCTFIEITNSTVNENGAHGNK